MRINMNRNDALQLLFEHTKSDSLRKHAFAVEAAMRHFAHLFGEDEEKWAIAALLHDFDYEEHPSLEEHPLSGTRILESLHYPEDIILAIKGHADHLKVPRETLMAKTLYAIDELAGFIIAVALVRPSKKIADVPVSSVKKKMKDKAFARNVNRDEIIKGAQELNMELDAVIDNVIKSLQAIADTLGL
ncbi:MAG: HAD family hydrolase [Candidatus Fischerbacteria bacterium RBG_13_37_8]|uniref:HAD family hydrolase n=1 Tax=Candidatus Fischerbacteria bacterium RBG_13_37_8 TaxID=1817863 RepID=A0A1F5VVI7_9BACT|nr:MAG: HAD family hydrolase [Candidatus Fischerbacteria bacterium RBG_13_37_8]